MKRHRLWILTAAGLFAGCAAHPQSETEAVASRVLHERPATRDCRRQEVYYCRTDINSKVCGCVDSRDAFGPAWGPLGPQTVR